MKRAWPVGLIVALVAGCAGLPTSGPVQVGLERAPEPEGIVFLAPDPEPGAGPLEIVTGFLDAATAGVADRYETAQRYLTDAARHSWNPSDGVTIYSGTTPPKVTLLGPNRVAVTVNVAGHVDHDGVYTQQGGGLQQSTFFTLTEEGGQWRISDLDDGVLISSVNFGTQFRQTSLAFFSPDGTYLIPDPRWFPEQNAASFAVTALLNGPSEWLAPGVRTAIPPGTTAEPVNVSDGTAEVTLSQTALAATPFERDMVLTQLEETLTALPQVHRVRVTVDGSTYLDGGSSLTPALEASVGHSPYAITDTEVGIITGGTVVPLEGVTIEPDRDYTALAVPYGDLAETGLPIAAQVGKSSIESLATPDEPASLIIDGTDLLAPSYDPYGWLWSGEKANSGSLLATQPGSEVVSAVGASDLRDQRIRAIRLSRDGARIAIIQERGARTLIQVAIVFRDGEGAPLGIGTPATISSVLSDAVSLVWVDRVTLGVLGRAGDGTVSMHTVPLSGAPVALLSVQGAIGLAGGRGERELWVATKAGELYSRAGNGWRKVGDREGVRAIAFPG